MILEAGLGEDLRLWTSVMPLVAETTRVCAYDRAGVGGSLQGSQPRTAQAVVDELHELLRNADIGGPYVLAAHSFGGVFARSYADRYSDDVTGMVLVDSSHPDEWARYRAALPARRAGEDEALAQARTFLSTLDDPSSNPEGLRIEASSEEAREAGSLGSMPLVVLSHGLRRGSRVLPPGVARRFDSIDRELQRELAKLSSNSVHAIAAESGPIIPREQPELVAEAIRRAVGAARNGEMLPPCGGAFERLGGECVPHSNR